MRFSSVVSKFYERAMPPLRYLEVHHVACSEHVVRSIGEASDRGVILNVAVDIVDLHLRVRIPKPVDGGCEVAANST